MHYTEMILKTNHAEKEINNSYEKGKAKKKKKEKSKCCERNGRKQRVLNLSGHALPTLFGSHDRYWGM